MAHQYFGSQELGENYTNLGGLLRAVSLIYTDVSLRYIWNFDYGGDTANP
ncbi:hypothetical protein [Gelidibacter sp.]